jgi:hypothetical protein
MAHPEQVIDGLTAGVRIRFINLAPLKEPLNK